MESMEPTFAFEFFLMIKITPTFLSWLIFDGKNKYQS